MAGVMVPMSSSKLVQGRSGVSGITATIFGATGFLGKYVVNRFGKIGSRLILPQRGDYMESRHLKLSGDLGVVSPIDEMSIRSLAEIEAAVAESNVVINLVGKHFETSRWSFTDVHATFPAVLAQVCADVGVERLIHVSALGAAVDSPSAFLRSKALGEEAVMEAFPGATILRPATIFGDEDKFLNRIAKVSQLLPIYPMSSDDLVTKQQPVYMDDVAAAVYNAATSRDSMGKVYELAGPKTYTNKELVDYVFDMIKEDNNAVAFSPAVAKSIAFGLQQIPNPWMTADAMRRTSVDLTMPEGALGLSDLGVTSPMVLEDIALRYLVRFRQMSYMVDDDNNVVNQKSF
jgi:NADH dehydrogenase (ubiquinone) 1 alpha subcomplex subunit 9